jgi:hypothetical protein
VTTPRPFIYATNYPKPGFERTCPHTSHLMWNGREYVDAPKVKVSPKVAAAINEIIRRERLAVN